MKNDSTKVKPVKDTIDIGDIIEIDISSSYPVSMTANIIWEGNNEETVKEYLKMISSIYGSLSRYPDFLLYHKYCKLTNLKPHRYTTLHEYMKITDKRLYVAYLSIMSSSRYGILYEPMDELLKVGNQNEQT